MRKALKKNNEILIKFQEYDSYIFNNLLNHIKKIEGRYWNSNTKTWSLPLSKKNIEIISELGFILDVDLKNFFEQHKNINVQKEIEKIQIKKNISLKLRPYQIFHTKNILYSFINENAALDASDTGTGKTYVALAVAKQLKLFPIILTRKSAIHQWKKVAEYFKLDCYVSNYEQFKYNNTSYLESYKTDENINIYKWNNMENSVLIFDEVHKCKNRKTLNSKILLQAKKQNLKILALSATIADNPLQMYAISQILNICNEKLYWSWIYQRGVSKNYWGGLIFNCLEKNLKKIHKDIFPKKGSRISIKELGDIFPKNMIISECCEMKESIIIQNCYEIIKEELRKLKEKTIKDKASILTQILRERQKIELLKISTFIELAEDYVEEGASVIIFVNFKETVNILCEKLNTTCVITGDTSLEDRQKNIEDFQTDKKRIIICNSKAGGESISLHDINGKYNRIVLISPTYSAQDLIQILGRAHRDGGKSPVIQKILFCSNTKEEEIAEKVEQKIKNIKLINDGDLI